MTPKPRLSRDSESGLAYLHLADIVARDAVMQRTVSVADEDGDPDLVLDFDREGRLLGIEFLREAQLPPGW